MTAKKPKPVALDPVCECGRATGYRCDWEGECADLLIGGNEEWASIVDESTGGGI